CKPLEDRALPLPTSLTLIALFLTGSACVRLGNPRTIRVERTLPLGFRPRLTRGGKAGTHVFAADSASGAVRSRAGDAHHLLRAGPDTGSALLSADRSRVHEHS